MYRKPILPREAVSKASRGVEAFQPQHCEEPEQVVIRRGASRYRASHFMVPMKHKECDETLHCPRG